MKLRAVVLVFYFWILDLEAVSCPTVLDFPEKLVFFVATGFLTGLALVSVLGKGHEKGQEINGKVHEFDDRIELAKAIEVKK